MQQKLFIRLTALNSRKVDFFITFLLFFIIPGISHGQAVLTGRLVNETSHEPVGYANLVLYRLPDSAMVAGTASDTSGVFRFKPQPDGDYTITASVLGYQSLHKNLRLEGNGIQDAGIFEIAENRILLSETVAVGERIKARAVDGKATYFITKKMADASNSGTDILRQIPGVSIDLMNNISLEGSSNILILVDGRERDKHFVSQIHPDRIDRVEIGSSSALKYDGSATGTVSIFLKKDSNDGVSGHLYAEIPVSTSFVFLHPTYSITYGAGKFNLFTSYNGEMSYFDIRENLIRNSGSSQGWNDIATRMDVRQKNWSHRFHFGIDYLPGKSDQFNFYGFFNPYSWEHDGATQLDYNGPVTGHWEAGRDDTDRNQNWFYSLYYKHQFGLNGSEISFDLSHNRLQSENRTIFIPIVDATQKIDNVARPFQKDFSLKADFSTAASRPLGLNAGLKFRVARMEDKNPGEFRYTEKVLAAYISGGYKTTKLNMAAGLRVESSFNKLRGTFSTNIVSLLPNIMASYRITSAQTLQVSVSRSVSRPRIYQLNPAVSSGDPFSFQSGNPLLKPELRDLIYAEYAVRFNNNYLSARLFCSRSSDFIQSYMFLNDSLVFETQNGNLGNIIQAGLQASGSLKVGKLISFNPYLRLYRNHTQANGLASEHSISNRGQWVAETSLSALLSFKHGMNLSVNLNYASPRNNIQGSYYCETLYFISFEKTIKDKLKIGVTSALPGSKTFVYLGNKVTEANLTNHYEGVIDLPRCPFWFKISYQFSSGSKREKIVRTTEPVENLPAKGF
jgi:outer membrane receptor protein involved in Fe transport